MKRFFKLLLIAVLVIILAASTYILVTFPPVMAGMAAKTMCSCVFISGRDEQSVRDKELRVFPGLSSSTITLNADSSVSATVLWKTSKAIFRKGLGCTLLSQQPEEVVRAQKIIRAGSAHTDADTLAWPDGNVTERDSNFNVITAHIENTLAEAFDESDPGKPKNTHAIVVVYRNQIIGERYASGFDMHSKLMGWSMTKSITNALVGILVHEKKLDVQQPAPVAEWKADERSKITLHHLLQASSGLKWSESYFSPTADFHQMFIKSDDKGSYAASAPLAHEPGSVFQYSSGSTNIISRIIRQSVGDTGYYKFPYEKLFYKIGMHDAVIEPDASGTFVGSSYSFASARDWARFGLLFLNDGVWNGERILPEGWVKYSTTPAPAAPMGRYGAHWWLNAGDANDPQRRTYTELPTDAYWADGFEDQTVMIIPSKQLVIVRLGVSHHGFDFQALAKGIIEGLPK